MKDYFTTKDRAKHFFVVGITQIIKDLANSDALSPFEAKNLKTAATCLDKANDLIFERLGTAYRKKVLAMNRDNKIDLVSRYGSGGVTISNVASEDIEPTLEDLRLWKCTSCDSSDKFKDCAVYNMCVACDCRVNDYKSETCPFKANYKDNLDIDEDL